MCLPLTGLATILETMVALADIVQRRKDGESLPLVRGKIRQTQGLRQSTTKNVQIEKFEGDDSHFQNMVAQWMRL